MTKCYAKKEKQKTKTNKQTSKQKKQNKNMSTRISLCWADYCISTVVGIFIFQKNGESRLVIPKKI